MPEIQIISEFAPLFDSGHPNYKTRYLVFYGGRASGKSLSVAKGLLMRGMQNKEKILCTRELQTSIADSVIKTLEEEIDFMGLRDFYEVQANGIYGKNGTEFLFKGLRNNIQSIKSIPGITLCWVEEAQTVSHSSYEVLIPTIRSDGSQIIVTFNPTNPTDPTFERFVSTKSPDIYAAQVNYDKNPFLPETIRQEIERLKRDDPKAYEHVYCGAFDTRRSGVVYAGQMQRASNEGRITICPYDPSSEVFTAWDLGFGDATSIWWAQFVGRELRWIDFYENSGEQLDHYAQLVKAKPYNYFRNGHFLPHDGAAGNIRGLTPSHQLTQLGLNNQILPRESSVEVGIERLRRVIAYSVFDKDSCKDGIHALNNYHYEYDEIRQRFKNTPVHDWSSNAADAARYMAQAAEKIKGSTEITIRNKSEGISSINIINRSKGLRGR